MAQFQLRAGAYRDQPNRLRSKKMIARNATSSSPAARRRRWPINAAWSLAAPTSSSRR